MNVTHTQKNKTVTCLKDGSTEVFKSVNKAKKFMRTLPQHHTGARK